MHRSGIAPHVPTLYANVQLSSGRTKQTLTIERLLQEGKQSLSTIAALSGVTRQRVQYINKRLFTNSLTQPPEAPQAGVLSLSSRGAMIDLSNKPVANRHKRPAWVMNDKELMLMCVGEEGMRRFKIAQMYWRQNMSARDIACSLNVSLKSVERVLERLKII